VLTVSFWNDAALSRWAASWGGLGMELVVASNGASPGALDALCRAGARVVGTGGNRGYGPALGMAAGESGGDVLLLTNPDTLPPAGFAAENAVTASRPGSILSWELASGSGSLLRTGGAWPDVGWVRRQVLLPARPLWRPGVTDWVQGALMLIRREDFLDRLGGFDPSFPLYFEDVDICSRARALGMAVARIDGPPFVHLGGSGAAGAVEARLAGFHWGLCRWFEVHRPSDHPEVRRLVLLKCRLRSAVFRIRRPAISAGYTLAAACISEGLPPVLPNGAGGAS